MTSTMERLQQLVTLKQHADTLDGLDTYVAALYSATTLWCAGAHVGVAALHIDGLVDHAAHDTDGTGPETALDARLSPEPGFRAQVDEPGLERLRAARNA